MSAAESLLLARLPEQAGGRLLVGSHKPFMLDEPERVWLIVSGTVDVFAVRLGADGPDGARRHVFRAEAGSALFGMNLKHYGREVGLVAVGSAGTELQPLTWPMVEAFALDPETAAEAADLVRQWAEGLSSGLAQYLALPARGFEALEAGHELALKAGAIARPRRGLLWVSAPLGITRFMGWEELPLMGEDDFLPISEQTWLQAVGPSHLLALDTETFLTQPYARNCLDNFHRMALDLIIWNVQREERAERERLKARAAANQTALRNASALLASVLQPHQSVALLAGYGLEDPLVTACRLVGGAMGIEVRPRPDPLDGQAEAQTLEGIAAASRMRVRQVALREGWWQQDNGPLLAFGAEDQRPVALLSVSPGRYVLHDPSARSETPLTAAVAAALNSRAYAFYCPLPDEPLRGWWAVLRFGLRGARRDLWTVLLMGVAGGALGILPPLALGWLFNTVIPLNERSLLVLVAAALVCSAIAAALLQITRGVAILRIESRLDATLQAAVWDRLLKLPMPFFRAYTAGDLSSRALGIGAIRGAVSGSVVLSILSGVFSLFNFALLFFISAPLALLATGLVLVAVVATVAVSATQTAPLRGLSDVEGRISGLVLQLITGISKLRIAGVEARAFAFWAREYSAQRRLALRVREINNRLLVFNAAFTVLALLVLFAAAGERSLGLNSGAFAAFVAAFNQFLGAGLLLSSAVTSLLRIVPSYERTLPILYTAPEVSATKADPGVLFGEIEISRVNFRYTAKAPLVLDNISLHVRRGEFVALVGASGSGKSTLLRLLLGFEQPDSGGVFYDGQNLNGLDLRAVRRQLGVVLQSSQLMTGDLYTNIAGQAPLTLDEAWDAARMAGLEEDVRRMPMGLRTFISAGGSTLSGGQRQRVLIARAIAKKPRILLFDEATSALDNQTQAVVTRSLAALDATRIVIAHRLSTIMTADRIVVMDKGRIVQEGTFAELMRDSNGLFYTLAQRQMD